MWAWEHSLSPRGAPILGSDPWTHSLSPGGPDIGHGPGTFPPPGGPDTVAIGDGSPESRPGGWLTGRAVSRGPTVEADICRGEQGARRGASAQSGLQSSGNRVWPTSWAWRAAGGCGGSRQVQAAGEQAWAGQGGCGAQAALPSRALRLRLRRERTEGGRTPAPWRYRLTACQRRRG